MSAEVIDFTPHALQRLADRAMASGNPFECYCLVQLIDGYNDGLWTVDWIDGEPIFKAIITEEEREMIGIGKSE